MFARNNAGTCYLHEPWLPGRFCESSRFTVRMRVLCCFWLFFVLSSDFSYRCWSSPAETKWKFWKLCDSAGVKWRPNACMHVTTTTHFRSWFTNGTLSVEFVWSAIFFLQSVFNALGRGNLFRIGLIRIIQTCVITWNFSWKFSSFLDRSNCFCFL